MKELGFRWASSLPGGGLHFHWKCLMAPPKITDYIVVHELCHMHHRDHTDLFWNEVDKVMPDYRERKEWLRQRGAGMGAGWGALVGLLALARRLAARRRV